MSLKQAVIDRVLECYGPRLRAAEYAVAVAEVLPDVVEAWLEARYPKAPTCQHCGRAVDVNDTHVTRDAGLYCSMACVMRSMPPAVPAEPPLRLGKHGDPHKAHHPACKKSDDHEGHCIDPRPTKTEKTSMNQPNPILQYFRYEHLPEKLQTVSKPFGDLAQHMAETLPPSAETSAGLRKLLEAKDCAVRAALTPPALVTQNPG